MPQIGLVEIVLVAVYALVAVGIVLAVVGALFLGVRWLARSLSGSSRRLETELGLEVLEGRQRRGEITREEFEQAKRTLGA